MHGVVIDKKLFARSVKDKRKRIQDKEDLKALEDLFDTKFSELKHTLVDKLYSVLNGKTSQGVFNDLGEEVFPKGKKFTQKMLNSARNNISLPRG